jgi:cyanophycin synthetase
MEVSSASKGKQGKCAACGDSPVMHSAAFFTSTIEAWLIDRVNQFFPHRTSRRSLTALKREEVFESLLIRFARLLRLAKSSHNPELSYTFRSQVMWEEALRRGIPMEQQMLFGAATELYRAQINGVWHYFVSLPIPVDMQQHMFTGIDDKQRLKQFLQAHNVPVSRAICVTSITAAREAFETLQKPLVVKPRIGSRARHTTTNIRTLEDLETAYRLAHQLCGYVLIEEHLDGPVSRATVIDGKLRGFLQMFPARVTGDGAHSIKELLDMKNASRHADVQVVIFDAEHRAYLRRSGFDEQTVLERGATIDLSRRTGRFQGGVTREMPASVHPKLKNALEHVAVVLGAPVIGFDLIIEHPESDPDSQRWGVLEANSLPYIDLHYLPLEGTPSNVAAAVWDLWDKKS